MFQSATQLCFATANFLKITTWGLSNWTICKYSQNFFNYMLQIQLSYCSDNVAVCSYIVFLYYISIPKYVYGKIYVSSEQWQPYAYRNTGCQCFSLRDCKTHHVHVEKMSRVLDQMSSLVHRTASHSVLCQVSALLHWPWVYFPSVLGKTTQDLTRILLCVRIAFSSSLCKVVWYRSSINKNCFQAKMNKQNCKVIVMQLHWFYA